MAYLNIFLSVGLGAAIRDNPGDKHRAFQTLVYCRPGPRPKVRRFKVCRRGRAQGVPGLVDRQKVGIGAVDVRVKAVGHCPVEKGPKPEIVAISQD